MKYYPEEKSKNGLFWKPSKQKLGARTIKVTLAIMTIIYAAFVSGLSGQEPDRPRSIVGAIRWDAWHGDQGMPGKAVQAALGPKEWHSRLPFFAEITGDGEVRIDGSSQSVMDQEIEYAHNAGLDYWAFVTYAPDTPMSLGLKRYLASEKRNLIRFCLITECGRWRDPKYVERLSALMAEPGYLTVLDNRPVLYLGFISNDKIRANWGNAKTFAKVIDGLRTAARNKQLGNPYIVIMDFNPNKGKKWLDALGCDALSSYATQGGGQGAPYSDLARHAERFWDRCRATGAQVVPIVMSGWDRRPRIARPVPWETWQQPGVGMDKYYNSPRPEELAEHVTQALNWLKNNRPHAQAALAIIYAWNENDEGGWLVPTLSEGTSRLDALSKVLKTEDKSTQPTDPGDKK